MGNWRKKWGTKRGVSILLLLIAVILMAQAVYADLSIPKDTMRLAGSSFKIRVADTDKKRIQGLSGTNNLPADEAMLFIFTTDSKWSIWMKDMNYPIDIVWLDDSKKVVDFVTNVPPDSYPDKTFSPKEDARYVVEFRSGIVKEKGITIGQVAAFSGTGREI
jgi:uncharacterized membrane protein (UPF0127 family)